MILLRSKSIFNTGFALDRPWRVCLGAACIFAAVTLTACGGGGGSTPLDAPAVATNTSTSPSSQPTTSPAGATTSGSPAGSATPEASLPNTPTGSAPVNTPTLVPVQPSVTTSSTPPTAPPTATTTTSGTGSRTTPPTTSTTGGPTADAAPSYNSCANPAEVDSLSKLGSASYQRYVISGSNIGGDVTQDIATTNEEQQGLNGLGLYYVKSQTVSNEMDGVAIPEVDRVGEGKPTGKTVFYYELAAGLIGLVGEQQFRTQGASSVQLYTNMYSPIFYDKLFTLTAGQQIVQSEAFTQVLYTGDIAKAQNKGRQAVRQQAAMNGVNTTSQRIKFLGVVPLKIGEVTYSTCKFEVQDTDPPSPNITTQWYLEGQGVLVESKTVNGAGSEVRTQRLETAIEDRVTIFPRTRLAGP